MKVYTYKGCGTCKKAVQWLRAGGVEFEEIPIRESPPAQKELRAMLDFLGGEMRCLFNTSGGDYREMGIKDKLPAMTVEEVIRLLHGNGNLVKRPFVIGEGFGLVGFREEEWGERLKAGS